MKDLISHQLVKYLEGRGVTYIFGLCGHTNIAVLTALEKSSIKFVNTRHEQVAAHAADGYPRYPSEDCYFIAGTQGSLAVPTVRTWIYVQGEKAPGWHTPFVEKTLPLAAMDPLASATGPLLRLDSGQGRTDNHRGRCPAKPAHRGSRAALHGHRPNRCSAGFDLRLKKHRRMSVMKTAWVLNNPNLSSQALARPA